MKSWKYVCVVLIGFFILLQLVGCDRASTEMPVFTTVEQSTMDSEGTLSEIHCESSFTVYFLDVGQADAAIVACDGHFMMIDGGNRADSQYIYSVVQDLGIQSFDYVIATHPHEDHIGGLPAALNAAETKVLISNTESYDSIYFTDLLKYAQSGVHIPIVNEVFHLGSAEVIILSVNSGTNENDASIVLRVDYGKTSLLFTGDAGIATEDALIKSGAPLRATVLKVGHHGSDSSTSEAFLAAVQPEYAVISVGDGNQFGHPTDLVLEHLLARGMYFYRTDLQGMVTVRSDGNEISVSTERSDSFENLIKSGAYIAPYDETGPVNEYGEEIRYIINTKSGKFHYPNCSSVESMKDSNRMEFTGSRDQLIAQGYQPCGACHP